MIFSFLIVFIFGQALTVPSEVVKLYKWQSHLSLFVKQVRQLQRETMFETLILMLASSEKQANLCILVN